MTFKMIKRNKNTYANLGIEHSEYEIKTKLKTGKKLEGQA